MNKEIRKQDSRKNISQENPSIPKPNILTEIWTQLPIIFLSILLIINPFFPDVQIIRPKLLVLELGIFIIVLSYLIQIILSGSIKYRKTNLNIPVLIYVVYIFLIYLVTENKPVAVNELKRMLLCSSIYFVTTNIIQTDKNRHFILISWVIGSTWAVIYGLLQRNGGIWILQVPQMSRVYSTFGNPIFFAAYLVIFIPVIIALLFYIKKSFLKLILFLITVLCLIALYFTQTRSAWIGFAVSIIVYGLLNIKSRKTRFMFISGFVFFCIIFSFLTWHIWLRHQAHPLIWRDTFRMWLHYPIFGTGPGTFHINFPKYASKELLDIWPQKQAIINDAHNEYIQILSEVGIVGLSIFFLLIISFYRFALRIIYSGDIKLRQKIRDLLLISGFISSVTAILIQNLFSVDMRFIISSVYMFFVIGLVYSYEENEFTYNLKFPTNIKVIILVVLLLISGIIGFSKSIKLHICGIIHYDLIQNKLEIKPSDEGTGLLSQILKPYLAEKKLSQTPDFFDEKILEPLKTIDELESLRRKYPREPKIYEQLGWVYAKEKNFTKAIEYFEYTIKLNPSLFGPYNNLGNIYFLLGNRAKAIEYYKKSIAINPNQVDAHTNLGITYYYEGKLKESADEFNIVLKLDPKNEKAIVMLKKMRE